MNISDDSTRGRILLHGAGSGDVSRAAIERRARELADIDGRPGAAFTDDDFSRARAELLGLGSVATDAEEEEASTALSRDPGEPPSDSGHAAPTHEGPDEAKTLEGLALEGVEEAQHDQMLAARRRERRLDEQGL